MNEEQHKWYWRGYNDAKKYLTEQPAQQQEPVANDGWLQSGGLLYRLTDERRPQNRDEINVTMVDGSRSIESCTRRAGELLDRIRSSPPASKSWVGLTQDELSMIGDRMRTWNSHSLVDVYTAIEAKLREKNAPQQSKEDA